MYYRKVLFIIGAGEGLPHTAGTHLLAGEGGDAVFVLGQTGGTLLVVKMYDLPYSVFTETIKNASLMNRLFTGFVPGMFRFVCLFSTYFCFCGLVMAWPFVTVTFRSLVILKISCRRMVLKANIEIYFQDATLTILDNHFTLSSED